MKKTKITLLMLVLMMGFSFAKDGFAGRPITTNVFMDTGYTLNKGEFMLGLGSLGFGITDNVQVGTNVLLFLFQDYNADFKISFIKNEQHALALGIDLNYLNLDVADIERGFTSISPFATFTTKVSTHTFIHLGGRYSYFSGDSDIDDAEPSPASRGTSVYLGIEYGFSNRTKFLAESGYDITFKGFRLGGAVLFAWHTFHLKLGVNYFKPEGSRGYTMPVIGIYWRFDG